MHGQELSSDRNIVWFEVLSLKIEIEVQVRTFPLNIFRVLLINVTSFKYYEKFIFINRIYKSYS